MFDDVTLGAQVLKNPAMVQGLVLTEFQNRLGGIYSVADPNNSFNLILEAASSLNAQNVRYMESQFEAQYAVRALTSADLYNNMSDFDYLNLVATPTDSVVKLTFDVDYLIANALSYDATYNRVVIPAITQFYIGPLTFGIYYPINININKVTKNINVLWDTTTTNPLQSLETNMVQFFQYSYGGLNLITLTIPVSQFSLSTSTFPVVAQQGFIKNIQFTDQFYAVRVFTNLPTGGQTELAYTLSETVYDPTTPTAKINIQNDTNTLVVSIPQIYFTNNQIGNQVQVSVLTTKGALTLDLTSVELSTCNVAFGIGQPGVTQYSSILANLSTIDLIPGETVITGGSNALTFSQLRNLIVNGGLYTSAPVTPAQLNTFASKNGFSITKYLDNVTDRIYFASNTITGTQNGSVMVTTGNINVTSSAADATSSILSFPSNNSITILPTTVYNYDETTDVCTPLTDVQLAYLTGLTGQAFVNEVNTNSYTKCPFHIVTYTASQYPVTKSFNLMNPSVNNIRFITDNTLLTPQMSVVSAAASYVPDWTKYLVNGITPAYTAFPGLQAQGGAGGFLITLGVVKNPAMAAVPENSITVVLTTVDSNNTVVYGTATLISTTSSLYIYQMPVSTNFYITEDGTIQSYLSQLNATTAPVELFLSSTFNVIFLVDQALYPNIGQNSNIVNNIPTQYNTLLGVSRQAMDITFGTDLSDQVYNITNATWSSTTYATYPENVYLTYTQDVYEKSNNGALVYAIVGGAIQLNKLNSAGDPVLNPNSIITGLTYTINSSTSISVSFPSEYLSAPGGAITSPQYTELLASYTQLQTDAAALKATIDSLTTANPALLDDYSAIQTQLASLQTDITSYNVTPGTFSIILPDGTSLTNANIGKILALSNFTTSNTPSGTYAITDVTGNSITFAVGGFPTSGTGTCTIGNPIVQYLAGSYKLDPYGNTIAMNTRSLQYYTTSIMFDLRLFYSQNTQDIAFVAGLTSTLTAYFDTIATLQNNLLEMTQLYYVPNKTMGAAAFSAGNNVPLNLPLGFSFVYTVYVSQSTLSNAVLQASISADILAITQAEMANSIISLTDIAQNIKTQLSDTISSVDVDGIDGTQTLQTVIVPAGTNNPIIAQQLVWSDNTNTMALQPAVVINFALAA